MAPQAASAAAATLYVTAERACNLCRIG